MKRVIITADDFGLTEEGNKRIMDVYRNNTVTTTSLIATGKAPLFSESVSQLKKNPELDVGIHIVLCSEPHKKLYPVSSQEDVSLLIDKDGAFISDTLKWLRRLSQPSAKKQIQQEIEMQIRRVLEAGIIPSFVSGHMYTIMVPQVFEITLNIAKKFGIKWIRVSDESPFSLWIFPKDILSQSWLRASALWYISHIKKYKKKVQESGLYTTDYFTGTVGTMQMSKRRLLKILKKLPEGMTELIVHPGSSEIDYRTLISPSLIPEIKKFNINLTSFRELRR